jgi:hypothetical protein
MTVSIYAMQLEFALGGNAFGGHLDLDLASMFVDSTGVVLPFETSCLPTVDHSSIPSDSSFSPYFNLLPTYPEYQIDDTVLLSSGNVSFDAASAEGAFAVEPSGGHDAEVDEYPCVEFVRPSSPSSGPAMRHHLACNFCRYVFVFFVNGIRSDVRRRKIACARPPSRAAPGTAMCG